MIDPGLHGGGGTLTWWQVALVFGGAMAAAYGLYKLVLRRRRKPHTWRTLQRPLSALVAYDSSQLCAQRAQAMADNLWRLHDKVWAYCRRLYGGEDRIKAVLALHGKSHEPAGKELDHILCRIILNATLTENDQPKAIKLYLRAAHIHMRPTGTRRMYLLFALEVHQLYRAWALGFDRYGKPDADDADDVQRWAAAVAKCKALVGDFA